MRQCRVKADVEGDKSRWLIQSVHVKRKKEEVDGKRRLPSGSGSLAMLSNRRHRLNVRVWQAWWDNTHLEEAMTYDIYIRKDDGTGTNAMKKTNVG